MLGINELEKAEQKIADLKQQLERANEEYEYLLVEHERLPFKKGETCWLLLHDGDYEEIEWGKEYHTSFFQGNIFKTEQEAEKERDKRILLTRFRQFRDKCNGDWKPDFKDDTSWKYYISFNHTMSVMKIYSCLNLEEFNLFGYFRKESDAERAVELFGDEIKRLFVEEEK